MGFISARDTGDAEWTMVLARLRKYRKLKTLRIEWPRGYLGEIGVEDFVSLLRKAYQRPVSEPYVKIKLSIIGGKRT